jgi:hypothetical protein
MFQKLFAINFFFFSIGGFTIYYLLNVFKLLQTLKKYIANKKLSKYPNTAKHLMEKKIKEKE